MSQHETFPTDPQAPKTISIKGKLSTEAMVAYVSKWGVVHGDDGSPAYALKSARAAIDKALAGQHPTVATVVALMSAAVALHRTGISGDDVINHVLHFVAAVQLDAGEPLLEDQPYGTGKPL